MAADILYLENFQRLNNFAGDTGPMRVSAGAALWDTDVKFTGVNGKRWMYFTSKLQYEPRLAMAVGSRVTIGMRIYPYTPSINLWGNGYSAIVGQEFYIEVSVERTSSTVIAGWYRVDGGPWLTAGGPFTTSDRLSFTPWYNGGANCAITDVYMIAGGMDDALGPINVTDVAIEVKTNSNWDVTNLTQVTTGDRGGVAKINSKDAPGSLKFKLKSLDPSTVGQKLVGMSVNLEPTWVPGYPGKVDTSLARVSGGIVANLAGTPGARVAVHRHIGVMFTDGNADLKTPQTLLDELTLTFTAVAP